MRGGATAAGRLLGPLLAAALSAPAFAGAAAAQAPWDRQFFNPAGLARPDDVVLPLPCGGAMAFRPVVTPTDTRDALADGAVQLGRSNEQTGYMDYLRRQHLLGTLARPDGTWYFLMAKFHVTVDQWNAVAEPGNCAAPTEAGRHPKGNVSWFEAADYGRRLTEWLLKEGKGALPLQGDETAFLRLPTEVEWEFAARGGIAVGNAQFAADRFFPEAEHPRAYVVHREPGRERRTAPVGSRKPNPLGLNDVLGNAEQWVLEPFRANRLGREHGQSGGVVARGGSYDTDADGIRTSLRSEYPSYNRATGLAWRHPKIGLRLVVAAPVLSSARRTDDLQQAWITLNRAGDPVAEAADPAEELGRLAAGAADAALRTRLEALKRQVLVERGQRDEAQGRLFRTALLNGVLLVRGLQQDTALADNLRRQVAFARQRLEAAQRARDTRMSQDFRDTLQLAEARFTEADERRRLAVRAYTDAVVQLADDISAEQQAAQRERLSRELDASGFGVLKPCLRLFDRALGASRARREMGGDALVRSITEAAPCGS